LNDRLEKETGNSDQAYLPDSNLAEGVASEQPQAIPAPADSIQGLAGTDE
jgi:hypothetical protein